MSEVIFKAAVFGGFDRQEVLEYIDKMEQDAESEKQKFNDRIEEINIEKNDMVTEYYNMQQKLKTLELHLDEGNKIFDELKDGNRDLIGENLNLKSIIDEHRQAGERLASDFSNYQENMKIKEKSYSDKVKRLEKERNENTKALTYYKEKSERYDKLNENIDEIIGQAKNQTSFLMEKTYEETNKSAAEIQSSLEETVLKLQYFKKEIGNLKDHLTGYTKEIQSSLSNIDLTVGTTLQGIDVDGTKLTKEVVDLIESIFRDDGLSSGANTKDEKQYIEENENEKNLNFDDNSQSEKAGQVSGIGKDRQKKSRLVENIDTGENEHVVDFNMPETDLSEKSLEVLLEKDLKNIEGAMKFPFANNNNNKNSRGNKTYLEDVIREKRENKQDQEKRKHKKETIFNSFKFYPKNKDKQEDEK